MPLRIGLYGANGHQIRCQVERREDVRLVAVAAMPQEAQQEDSAIASYDTLEDMLADDEIDLISLCSPRRRDQAAEAIQCLEAGKHVYAEKPCATTEEDLDAVIRAAAASRGIFHEMAGTVFAQPYLAMRELVGQGRIGAVVQALAQKSYPYHERRPQDEDVDGGLTLQNGVHAMRFIEHITALRIVDIEAMETQVGNPDPDGGLRMATSYMMRLENGAVASVVANYLNQKGFGQWGNEHVRIFGIDGFVEAVDGGARTRLVVGETDHGELDCSAPSRDYFDMFVEEILESQPMPLSLETELHPTRMVIRARDNARRRDQ